MSKVKTTPGTGLESTHTGSTPANRPRGRPVRYQWSGVADEVCKRLENGESLLAICKDDHMPDRHTIHTWLDQHEGFRRQYARARGLSADTAVNDMLALADDANLSVPERKLRIDTRERYARLVAPRTYGTQYTDSTHQVTHRQETDREAIRIAYNLMESGVLDAEYTEEAAGPPPP